MIKRTYLAALEIGETEADGCHLRFWPLNEETREEWADEELVADRKPAETIFQHYSKTIA